MRRADHLIDLGPEAGKYGGQIMAQGDPATVQKSSKSGTGRFLSGLERIPVPAKRRSGDGGSIVIRGATANNLKNIDVVIPTGRLNVVTGVSGSGKSTLIMDILARAAAQFLHDSRKPVAAHKEVEGLEVFDALGVIDQQPIGRTPASNAATYTGIWSPIRSLFAKTPEAKTRGWGPGRFSFNVADGRCDACEGKGGVLVEMHFLSDVWVTCDECNGQRFNDETLNVRFKGATIADVLQQEVAEACSFFENIPQVSPILNALNDVGLGYLGLGQSATTLSGGEAQRIRLAAELGKPARGRKLYILDEPTTGLHFGDVRRLLKMLQRLVDRGDTVILIEHDLDVILNGDHVIDLGPDGGDGGGLVVAVGSPEEIARAKESQTGSYLAAKISRESTPISN